MGNEKKPDPVNLIQRLRAASQGETVWRIMDADKKAYFLEFSHHDYADPAAHCRCWLDEQNRRGNLIGAVAVEVRVFSAQDRLLQEAADEIDRLLKCEW